MFRILVVEDEEDIQKILENYLVDQSYAVTLASDGVDGIAKFHKGEFDLVLLDIMMPKIDGFGVCELIRRESIERERAIEKKRIAFFSAVSHELKTPLTILKGHLSGMLQGVGEYRNRDYYLQRSRETTEKMEDMVKELLTVSRIENNKFVTKTSDIAEQLRQQIADMAELIENKKLELEVDIPEHLYADVNPVMMNKVFSNLLLNAIRYTPEKRENKIRVSLKQKTGTGRVSCRIENTGVCIPKEALAHVFEAFYRVEQSRNRQTGGNGLGLYIVKMILDQHGAIYRMDNTREGVCFSFSL